MFSFLKQQDPSQGMCAIEVTEEGVAFAHALVGDKFKATLKSCGYYSMTTSAQLKPTIQKIVDRNDLYDVPCSLVLTPTSYRVLLVDKPNVAASEYQAAVRWQIKDLIDFPVDDAIVDIFHPVEGIRSYDNKLYAVVAERHRVKQTATLLAECHLVPRVVDIREFALRNLVLASRSGETTPAIVLDVQENTTVMLALQDNSISFIRRIQKGYRSLSATEPLNSLTYEIKRSLRFCETELKQELPKEVIFPPMTDDQKNALSDVLNELPMTEIFLDLNDLVAAPKQITLDRQVNCYVALGGVLRQEAQE